MRRRQATAAVLAAMVGGSALLAPVGGRSFPAARTVLEGRGLILDGGDEVVLGTAVSELGDRFAYEAYDQARGEGIVQWLPPDRGPVMILASEGVVRAISVAFDPAVRTSRGVGVGDPEGLLNRAYGPSLRARPAYGYLLEERGTPSGKPTYTYFDTACTGRVNAIGLALGAEGLGALGAFWSPADLGDPCYAVD